MVWNKPTLVAILILLASGCAQKKPTPSPAEAPAPTPAETATAPSGSASPKITALPNPYLKHQGKAPAAASQAFSGITPLITAGRFSEAETALLKLNQDYPKLSGPLVNLGLIYWKQKNYSKAQNAFENAQRTNPLNPDAYVPYGVMLREQGQFSQAEAQYQKSLAIWPHNTEALRNLGILYDLYLNQPAKALQQFQLCESLSTDTDKELKGWIAELQRRTAPKASE